MKNQYNKSVLDFNKQSITELNDYQINEIQGGGTSVPCSIIWVSIELFTGKIEFSLDHQV
jgi:hypothetical protein